MLLFSNEREREREEITCRKWNNIVNSHRLPLSLYGSHWERDCDHILNLTHAGDHFREKQPLVFIYLTVDGSLGKDFSFEHSERSSALRDLRLSMLGRHSRFLHSLRCNKVRAVTHSIDEGASFIISVSPK